MHHTWKIMGAMALATVMTLAGCAREGANPNEEAAISSKPAEATPPPSPELKPLVVKADPPPQPVGVTMAKETSAQDEDVVVIGRLKDFVAGKAAFTMVDGSIPSCKEDMDECETPWDYCCTSPKKVAANSALVQLIGENGKALDGNLQGVNSIDHLSTVVVTGKAIKDDAGNLTIKADKVYLE